MSVRKRRSELSIRRRQAAVILVSAAVGFVLLQLVLFPLVVSVAPTIRDIQSVKVERYYDRVKASPAETVKVVVMGSSHVLMGLAPKPWEGEVSKAVGGRPVIVYNMAIHAAGPVREYLLLRHMLERGFKPDVLVLEVLVLVMRNPHEGVFSEQDYFTGEMVAGDEIPLLLDLGYTRERLMSQYRESYFLPWYVHRFKLLSLTAPWLLPKRLRTNEFAEADDCGGLPPSPASKYFGARAQEDSMHEYTALAQDYELSGPSVNALPRLLELCRDNGITTAMLLMPESTAVREKYEAAVWPKLGRYLEEMSGRYGVPIIDAKQWLDDGDFCDGQHTYAPGQAHFSERFCTQELPPLIEAAQRKAGGGAIARSGASVP